jgi:hypothetical protein
MVRRRPRNTLDHFQVSGQHNPQTGPTTQGLPSMKNTHLLTALLASFALSSAAFAGTTENVVNLENGDQLVVSTLVNPSELPPTFTRRVLDVRFALNEYGEPHDVRVLSMADSKVKKQVVKAFKEWRFDVAALDRNVASQRYILPLDIIPEA